MPKLVFTPPGPEDPGYLERIREATQLMDRVDRLDPNAVDDLLAFLLQWVKEPKEKKEAKSLLLNVPRSQFRSLMQSIFASDGSSPPFSQTSSE